MWDITLAILAIAVVLWLIWRKRQFSIFKDLGIPGPEPNIFFGNLWDLSRRTPLECHKEWLEKYGKVVGYYFGTKPIILVADTDVLKKVQVSEFHKFVNRPRIFNIGTAKPKRGDGFSFQLTNLRDKRWKEIRSTLTPTFTTSKMKLMAPIINGAIDSLVSNIDTRSKEGNPFDIYDLYQRLTMDVIGRTAFGIQTDCQNNPDDPFLRSSRAIFAGNIASIFTVLAFSFPEFTRLWTFVAKIRLIWRNKGINPIKELTSSTDHVIQTRRDNASLRRQDLLQNMIDARLSDTSGVSDQDLTAGDEEKEKKSDSTHGVRSAKVLRNMNDDEILDNAVLFFLAGYETTSTALAFTTHFLLHYPEVQERVRTEIKDLMEKEGKLDYASVHQLQYLDQVLSESLRFYPPIYLFVNREAGEDVDFGDFKIKAGFPIQVPVYQLQHDADLWPDPENFDPERFSPENKKHINTMAFQPFGQGPRNCIGMRFAQMEAKMALARILLKYRLEKCGKTDKMPITLNISAAIIRPGKGIYVKAVPL